MRSLLLFAACSLLTVIPACGEKTIIVAPNPPADEPPTTEEEEPPVDTEPPPVTNTLVLDLGEVEVGKDIAFEVPEGALGFNITAEAKLADFDPQQPFGIERITDPKGKVLHRNFTPTGGTNPTSIASFDAIASASIPQADGAPEDLAGKWKVRFGVAGDATAKTKVKGRVHIQSSGDGNFHGGMLDLRVHIPAGLGVGGHIVDASKAESDPDLKERIDTFFAYTKELLGIERGTVSFKAEKGSFAALETLDEVIQGFALSTGETDGTKTLHVLITNLIADDGQPFALGISPGIPGAATIYGRSVSGIIVTTSDQPEVDALTMLHEAGHFFGLNHTTELEGGASDPLADTPNCVGSISQGTLFDCPDRANVMFVAGPVDSPVSLSTAQKRVYHGSPIYRALTAGGKTMSFAATTPAPRALPKRTFRIAGTQPLSAVERELATGMCGLTPIDATALVKRHGRAETIAQLQKAAADPDLLPYVRGRANLSLKALAAK